MLQAAARTHPARPTTAPATQDLYSRHVNPRWVRLLEILGMNATYTRCEGAELTTADGRRILDFLSGYCVYNAGHNHPAIISAIEEEMRRCGPTMLQSHVPGLAADLAARLCKLAGGGLEKVYFTTSGSEGIETVIKFARAFTGRPGLVHCGGSFHGLTNGALSLMGDPWWREGFGPLLPDVAQVPFGDLRALEERLASRRVAAFIVEPVQAESGILVPDRAFLAGAQELCRRKGTIFALDEVQTGLYRTGPFLAAHHFGLDPDMVVLAKAMSGGLVPCGAVLMTDRIHNAIYRSLSRAFIHASTFGENALSMRAALATLSVLEEERLGDRAVALGDRLRGTIAARLGRFEMFGGVRGLGMLNGIVLAKPESLSLRACFAAFSKVHPGMLGQMIVSQLFRREGILTQICGNNYMVLKAAPPLVATEDQVARFVNAVERVFDRVHSGQAFWTEGLSMVQRAVAI